MCIVPYPHTYQVDARLEEMIENLGLQTLKFSID